MKMGRVRGAGWAVLLVAWSWGLLAAGGAPGESRPPEAGAWTRNGVTMKVLANGLTVVLKENHTAPLAALRVYVKAGSLYEGEFLGTGISHVFEHLISGGSTSTRSETECQQILTRIGAQTNAYTTTDHTCYHGSTLAKNLPVLIDLVADWMRRSTFPQAEFEREMKVVAREQEMNLDDPQWVLYQAALQNAFRVHPVRHPVIGYRDLFGKLTRENIVRYYERMYTPNNMIVAAAGDFDAKAILEVVERAFGDWPRHAAPMAVLPEEPPQLARRFVEVEAPVERASMVMSFHTVPLAHPDLYPLDLIDFVLAQGESSRLVRRLRDRDRLVYRVSTFSYTPDFGCGRFIVNMNLPYENVQKAEAAVLEELERLKTEAVSEAELAQAKKQKVAENVFAAETVESQAALIGGNVLSTGDPLFNDVYVAGLQKPTAAELAAAARRYFRPENLSVTVLKPRGGGAPAATTAPAEGAGAIRRLVLPNGLVVLLRRVPGPKLVALKVLFMGGVRTETEETNGLCRLTAQMLPKGTTTRSATQIAEFFDSLGGTLAGSSGRNTFSLDAQVLSEDLEKALEVVADCLANPTFPESELAPLRERTLAAIDQRNDDALDEAMLAFRRAFFPRTPYRFDPLGARPAVEKLASKDLAEYYRRWGVANNGVAAVFGDIDLDRAEAAARRALGRLRSDPALTRPGRSAEPPLDKDQVVVRPTNKQQAAICFGFRGTDLANLEDRFALDVLDAVVSGADLPGGWLHEALRGAGLVYVVDAVNWLDVDPGYFGGIAVCQPEKADEVAATIRALLNKARAADVPADELERAKQSVIAARALNLQSASARALAAALGELYGLGPDFDERHAQRVSAVTAADVRRVAEKYLTRWLLLVARPASSAVKPAAE